MKITRTGNFVTVRLSERNLRDLLAAYERGENAVLRRSDQSEGIALTVIAEDDATHYATREAGPGLGYDRYDREEAASDR